MNKELEKNRDLFDRWWEVGRDRDNLRKAVEMAVGILESWGYASEELENGLSSLQSGIDKMSEHV